MFLVVSGFVAFVATLIAGAFWGLTFAHALGLYYVVGGAVLLVVLAARLFSEESRSDDVATDADGPDASQKLVRNEVGRDDDTGALIAFAQKVE